MYFVVSRVSGRSDVSVCERKHKGTGGTGAPRRGTCPQACFLEFLYCHVLSCLVFSCLVLSCLVLSCVLKNFVLLCCSVMCCVRVQSGSCFVLWCVVLCCVALCLCCVVFYPGLDHTLMSGFPGTGGTGAPKRGTCPQACFPGFMSSFVLSCVVLSCLCLVLY